MVWALNTDGIDVSGTDIDVTNSSVTNFDDSICVKPLSTCTSRVRISGARITYGVGVSMGSVPPDVGGNCIDGVSARDVNFTAPLKGVYIKPNPAKAGNATGRIANVEYSDMRMSAPLWWAVFVGTQQQSQPGGGADTGCSFLFPLPNTTCPTDPQVTLANITLRRVTVTDALLSPGILIANASNPGTGFVFEDVVFTNVSSWPVPAGYLVQSIHGIANGTTYPIPPGFVNATRTSAP